METIWFILWGVLWGAYFVLDGFDLGVGGLMPFLSRSEADRRAHHNAIGPFWDGNEVWLITAGGVTFAAFPGAYAAMFSTLYTPLMLILFMLILRGAALGMRSESDSPKWRLWWDRVHTGSSVLAAFLFGVAFANLFRGVPVDGEGVFRGSLLTLLNPYGLSGGLLFLTAFFYHGALWLTIKTDGDLQTRAVQAARMLWWMLLVLAVIFFLLFGFTTELLRNYLRLPLLWVLPAAAVAGLVGSQAAVRRGAFKGGWYFSALTIFAVTLSGVVGMFPGLLVSSLDPAFSRTVYNSASSPLTLTIMLVVVLVFVPLVIIYQAWVYRLFRGKVTGGNPAYKGIY